MAKVRLHIEQTDAIERFVPIPEYWDELSEDERKEWAEESLTALVAKHVKASYKVVE